MEQESNTQIQTEPKYNFTEARDITLSDGKVLRYEPKRLNFGTVIRLQKLLYPAMKVDSAGNFDYTAVGAYSLVQQEINLEIAKTVFGLPQNSDFTEFSIEDGQMLLNIVTEANFLDRVLSNLSGKKTTT